VTVIEISYGIAILRRLWWRHVTTSSPSVENSISSVATDIVRVVGRRYHVVNGGTDGRTQLLEPIHPKAMP
jgi:hypothetical protein